MGVWKMMKVEDEGWRRFRVSWSEEVFFRFQKERDILMRERGLGNQSCG